MKPRSRSNRVGVKARPQAPKRSGAGGGLSENAREREGAGEPAWAVDAAARLSAWFGAAGNARSLPWRDRPAGERDPYMVLVAETMLQQTQVSRIAERLPRFLSRFPTLADLAGAGEDEVLAEWSGLGYYRRARNLHAAARAMVREHGGRVPSDVEGLKSLPGVGRYTAGAVASLAYGKPEAIVDGNVARVLLRLHGRAVASDDRSVQGWLWDRAGELARAGDRPGEVNEALMELGATVCLPGPAAPACGRCPLAGACVALAEGRPAGIPLPKGRPARRAVYASAVVVVRRDGAVLMEQRPGKGMWSRMWQALTVEREDRHATAEELAGALGVVIEDREPAGRFTHRTTHRDVAFEVWTGRAGRGGPARGAWADVAALSGLALSNAQRRVLSLAGAMGGSVGDGAGPGLFSPRPR